MRGGQKEYQWRRNQKRDIKDTMRREDYKTNRKTQGERSEGRDAVSSNTQIVSSLSQLMCASQILLRIQFPFRISIELSIISIISISIWNRFRMSKWREFVFGLLTLLEETLPKDNCRRIQAISLPLGMVSAEWLR